MTGPGDIQRNVIDEGSGYPPSLIGVTDSASGAVFSLSDGRKIRLNISSRQLDDYLLSQKCPRLADHCENGKSRVYDNFSAHGRHLQMSEEEWSAISRGVRQTSEAKTVFSEHSRILAMFSMTYVELQQLPQRLYGGVACHSFTSFYTSPPLDFRPDDHRGEGWYWAMLDAPGGWLYKTSFNVKALELQVEKVHLPGHWLQPDGAQKTI